MLLAALLTALACTPAEVEVTFLGNEGFLLEAEGRKVLVDALVSTRMQAYVDQADELRAQLVGARAPYDEVDLVLATHVHGDHFDPQAVGRHLEENARAVFVSTEQAVAKLEAGFDGFAGIAERVRAVAPEEGEAVELPELGLTVMNLHHGKERTPPIQNHGFLIELGGLSFLHMGDTEVTAAELGELELDGRIDVAFVPSWYLDARPWKGAIEDALKPASVVVMHLAPRWPDESRTVNQRESRARVPRIRKEYPKALILERPGDSRRFPIEAPGDR